MSQAPPQREPLSVGARVSVVILVVLLLAQGGVIVVSTLIGRHLPDDLSVIVTGGSALSSALIDGKGRVITRFPLVEPLPVRPVVPDLLIDAFLGAAAPGFYEARASEAIPLAAALIRAAKRLPPLASPLSSELASLLLAAEPPGLIRRAREQIIASRLDARTPLGIRVTAWMERQPMCWGRRGLAESAARCLAGPAREGEEEAAIGPGHAAILAVAAASGLDLVDDPAMIQVRRDGSLQWLVANGWLESEAVSHAMRVRPARPIVLGQASFVEEVVAVVRRQYGFFEPNVVFVATDLDRALQARLDGWVPLRGGAWIVLDPRTGGVTALGGDAWAARTAGELTAVLPMIDAERLTLVELASIGSALVREGVPTQPRWFREVRMGSAQGTLLRRPDPPSLTRLLPAVDAQSILGSLPEVGVWKELPAGRTRILVSPTQIVVMRPSPTLPRSEAFDPIEVLSAIVP